MRKQILGVGIDDVNLADAVKTVEGWLSKKDQYYIVTTNPEFIMTAQEDHYFKKILNNADLSVPDGMGLKLSGDIVNNSPGIDLMEGLISMASEKAATVGFLGGGPGVADKIAECLLRRYPKLKISFASGDIEVGKDGREIESRIKNKESSGNKKQNSLILNSDPLILPRTDILFVALGHPKQEYWIYENLPKIPVKVAMGVGGSFDYISGKIPRAPFWMRSLGMEWLLRLIVQPWRIKRQIKLIKYIFMLNFHPN